MHALTRFATALLLATLCACGQGFGDGALPSAKATGGNSEFFADLPAHFPRPLVPADNPMTAAKVELGRHLFYDPRLSGNGTQACASCHLQTRAFTEPLETSIGSTGQIHPRNSQSLANIAYNTTLNWANPELQTLERQHITPITNTEPIVELGVNDANRSEVLGRLRSDALYQRLFAAAFPGEPDPMTLDHIVLALANFSRTLLSYRAPFDRHQAGDTSALSESAVRGMTLFNSDRLECNQCHGGFNFSDSTRVQGNEAPAFHNTGLYNITGLNGSNNYPAGNQGLFDFSGNPGDKGRMRAPTLRNIALTAPYNHDGSTATLSDVIDNYARGGRLVTTPLTRSGDGRFNSVKDGEIHGFTLTEQEKADLLAFLDSLTDIAFVTDERFSDPFTR